MAVGPSGHPCRGVLCFFGRNSPDICAQPRRLRVGRAARYGWRERRAISGLDGKPVKPGSPQLGMQSAPESKRPAFLGKTGLQISENFELRFGFGLFGWLLTLCFGFLLLFLFLLLQLGAQQFEN